MLSVWVYADGSWHQAQVWALLWLRTVFDCTVAEACPGPFACILCHMVSVVVPGSKDPSSLRAPVHAHD